MNIMHLPPTFVRLILRKRLLRKTVLNYTKCLNTFNNSQYCPNILRNCIVTDIIPNFLRLRVLLRTEMGRTEEYSRRIVDDLGKVRVIVTRTIDKRLRISVNN